MLFAFFFTEYYIFISIIPKKQTKFIMHIFKIKNWRISEGNESHWNDELADWILLRIVFGIRSWYLNILFNIVLLLIQNKTDEKIYAKSI